MLINKECISLQIKMISTNQWQRIQTRTVMNRKKALFALFIFSCSIYSAIGQTVYGTWSGELNTGVMKLGFVLHVDNDSTCRAVSPDQGNKEVAGRVAYLSEDSVLVKFPNLVALYGARLVEGELRGTFVQGLSALPLTLKRGQLLRQRPQTPQPPFPYPTEDVAFTNEQAGATLAGTLACPKDAKTVLLMVTGSGRQNRDEEIMGHKPFAVIADYLARHGIATLRYDDRGEGQSVGGDVKNATTKDLTQDALAGIRWLRQSGRFSKVGILGHSEGGMIAFMLGAQGQADFIVSLAGPGVQGDTLLLAQNKAIDAESSKYLTIAQIRANVARQQSPWLDFFIDYNPQADIARIACPVMALNGSKDCQVVASQNLPAIRRCLPANKLHQIKEYPDLNHLFQHCTTGLPAEYGDIEETFSPEVLQDMVTWIQQIK